MADEKLVFVWLSPEFLEWSLGAEGSFPLVSWRDAGECRRAYRHWAHMDSLISDHNDEYHLADAIIGLKRIVICRVKVLLDMYNFRKIPVKEKPSGFLELLSYFGIFRPKMFVELSYIRNRIEHHDETPPDKNKCIELCEFVWYFLRSTDGLVNHPVDGFLFEYIVSHSKYWYVRIEIESYSEWIIKVRWDVPNTFISHFERND